MDIISHSGTITARIDKEAGADKEMQIHSSIAMTLKLSKAAKVGLYGNQLLYRSSLTFGLTEIQKYSEITNVTVTANKLMHANCHLFRMNEHMVTLLNT